jgi:putative ABC transport system permease protein
MHAAPLGNAQLVDVHLDTAVLVFTATVALLTGVAFGVAPAFAASRPQLLDALRSGGPHGPPSQRARLREGLVVTELAAALLLLTGAGLLTRSLLSLLAVDPGFRADHLLVANLGRLYSSNISRAAADHVYDAMLRRLTTVPSVGSVALAAAGPLGGISSTVSGIRVDGTPLVAEGSSRVVYNPVSTDFFKTLGATIIAGRAFTPADRAGADRVAIVNRRFARRFLLGADPVGHQLQSPGRWTIVGEVNDIRQWGQDIPTEPEVFFPLPQVRDLAGVVLIRATGDPAALVEPVRRVLQEVYPEESVLQVYTLESELARLAAPRRVNAILLGIFAGLALLLAAVGLAGLVAGLVAERTREVGVRIALGAEQRDVLRLVVGEAARLVAIGGVIGLAAAVALTRVLRNLLFGITPTDLPTFVIVSLVLAAVALLAAAIPARRATRVDPMVALRNE